MVVFIFLPYSPELNPIEQFWSVVKNRVEKKKLLETDTLSMIKTEACQNVLSEPDYPDYGLSI